MKTIHFIRHAESQANAGQTTNDDSGMELTNLGKRQARVLAESMTQKPDLIIYSKYLRTQQTAMPLIQKFPYVPVKILPVHEFTYLSPMKCVQTTPKQRQNRVADYWEQADPDHIDGPDAESFTQFIERIQLCLDILATIEHHRIIVFTHGHVLRAMWQILEDHQFVSPDEQMHHFFHSMGLLPVPNTCVFEAIFQKNK